MSGKPRLSDVEGQRIKGKRAATASAAEIIIQSHDSWLTDVDDIFCATWDDYIRQQEFHIRLYSQKHFNSQRLKREAGHLDVALPIKASKRQRSYEVCATLPSARSEQTDIHDLVEIGKKIEEEKSASPPTSSEPQLDSQTTSKTLETRSKPQIKVEKLVSTQGKTKLEGEKQKHTCKHAENSLSNPILIDDEDDETGCKGLAEKIEPNTDLPGIPVDSLQPDKNDCLVGSPGIKIKTEVEDKQITVDENGTSFDKPFNIEDDEISGISHRGITGEAGIENPLVILESEKPSDENILHDTLRSRDNQCNLVEYPAYCQMKPDNLDVTAIAKKTDYNEYKASLIVPRDSSAIQTGADLKCDFEECVDKQANYAANDPNIGLEHNESRKRLFSQSTMDESTELKSDSHANSLQLSVENDPGLNREKNLIAELGSKDPDRPMEIFSRDYIKATQMMMFKYMSDSLAGKEAKKQELPSLKATAESVFPKIIESNQPAIA